MLVKNNAKSKSPRRHVEEEEERPRRRPSTRDDDEDEDDNRSSRGRGIGPTKKSGWAALTEKKNQIQEAKAARENEVPEFYLTEKFDTANVQFLHDEPVVVDGHQIKNDKGRWLFTPCQLEKQRHCLMCSDKIKLTTKYAFKVLDNRGEYDKDKEKFKNNKPIEKVYFMGMVLAEQLKTFVDKKNKELSECVIEISRSGTGKATSYNFNMAFDKNEVRIKPIKWEEQHPAMSKLVKPLKDEELEAMGFSSNEN